MALDGERQLIGRDADAVIDDLDARDAAAGQNDLDTGGAGIQRVLNQFLDRRRRALDDLAGGDAVNDEFWQAANGGHKRRLTRPPESGERSGDGRAHGGAGNRARGGLAE